MKPLSKERNLHPGASCVRAPVTRADKGNGLENHCDRTIQAGSNPARGSVFVFPTDVDAYAGNYDPHDRSRAARPFLLYGFGVRPTRRYADGRTRKTQPSAL